MSDAADCIFCKIVAGQIPALRVFEDEHILAFLDIGPLAEGHLLVIPKGHYAQLMDMPSQEVAALASQLPRLARAVVEGVSAEGCNILQNNGRVAGQVVEHVHWHIIPRMPGDGLGYRWNASEYAEGRADRVLASITAAIKD